MLLPGDIAFLDSLGLAYQSKPEGQEILVIVQALSLAARYKPGSADILIKVPPKYPAVKLDMFYTNPHISRVDGAAIPNLTTVTIAGQQWQQWSRHIDDARWRPNEDSLESYWFGLICKELCNE